MRSLASWIYPALFLCLVCLSDGLADEVVLTSGERFSSSQVWEEKGKIKFNMHGLVVSVSKTDVAEVIRSVDTRRPSADPTPSNSPPPDLPAPSPQSRIHNQPYVLSDDPPARAARPTPKPKPLVEKPVPQSGKIDGTGLEGVEWHMKPSDMPGLEKIKTDPAYGGIDEYWRPDENPVLDTVLLDGMVYRFWRNGLYSVMMWVNGRPGYKRLQAVISDRYGQGRPNSTGLERFIWIDQSTDRMLEFDEKLNTGIFWIRSRDLNARVKQLYP